MQFRYRYLISFSVVFSLLSCHPKLTVTHLSETHYTINENVVDSSAYKLIVPYKQGMEREMNRVLVRSSAALTRQEGESTLGNFCCDAALFDAKRMLGPDSLKIDAVVFNKGGLRNSLPQGDITLGNIYELMPFDNELVLLKMNAVQFADMLDKIAQMGGGPVSGIKMHIEQNKATGIIVNNKPYDPSMLYVVLTSDYLANGGDKYTFFANPLERTSLGIKLRDAMIHYCTDISKRGDTLKPYLDGRFQLPK